MKIGIIAIATASAAFSLLIPAAGSRGSVLNILTDPNAIPGSATTSNFFANSSPKFANADVEAAVYTKSNFELSFGSHPEINSADYVYVYQIFNDGTTPNAATQAVTFLSVGIQPGMSPYDISSTDLGNGSLIAPNSLSITADQSSAKWSYTASPFLAVNATSDYLFFASPFSYGSHSATLNASGIVPAVNGTLPSPVPEPAAFAFVFCFVGSGLLARRRTSN